jgi:hypothetical protein
LVWSSGSGSLSCLGAVSHRPFCKSER